MKISIFILFWILQVSFQPPHKDMIIKLEKDGSLVGLPSKYSPAHFDSLTFDLKIGKFGAKMPKCVLKNFESYSVSELRFTSSWYHDKTLLPNYIQMEISFEGQNFQYKLLYNLDTLEIFEIEKVFVVETSFLTERIEIDAECRSQILDSIYTQ